MSDEVNIRSGGRRIPTIWILPLVAALLGLWMVVYTAMNEGPKVTLTFANAEGIEEGKTQMADYEGHQPWPVGEVAAALSKGTGGLANA